MNVPVSGGTTEPMTMPVDLVDVDRRGAAKSCATQMPSSSDVRSRSVASRQLSHEPLALEHAEHDVGIADVNG